MVYTEIPRFNESATDNDSLIHLKQNPGSSSQMTFNICCAKGKVGSDVANSSETDNKILEVSEFPVIPNCFIYNILRQTSHKMYHFGDFSLLLDNHSWICINQYPEQSRSAAQQASNLHMTQRNLTPSQEIHAFISINITRHYKIQPRLYDYWLIIILFIMNQSRHTETSYREYNKKKCFSLDQRT